LLRILCMIAIIAHHCIGHGTAYFLTWPSNTIVFNMVIAPFGKICFMTFIAISTWFLTKSTFKSERFFKVWFETLFYNVAVVIFACLVVDGFFDTLSIKDWAGSFFPIFGNSHGFIAAYLGFYLMLPLLRMVSDKLNKSQLVILIVFLLLTQMFTYVSMYFFDYSQMYRSEIVLFITVYYVAAYLHNYPFEIQSKTVPLLMVFLIMWGYSAVTLMNTQNYPASEFWRFSATAFNSEFSIFNMIAGFALFFIFNNMKPHYSKTVNTIASTTLGILLMHDHNLFRHYFWFDIVDVGTWANNSLLSYIGMLFLTTLIIFTVCCIIDLIRIHTLEKMLIKSRVYRKVVLLLRRYWF